MSVLDESAQVATRCSKTDGLVYETIIDSSVCIGPGSVKELHSLLRRNGFLFFKNFLSKRSSFLLNENLSTFLKTINDSKNKNGWLVGSEGDVIEGPPRKNGNARALWKKFIKSREVQWLFNSQNIVDMLTRFFSSNVIVPLEDQSWLRVKRRTESTFCHSDIYYLMKYQSELLTGCDLNEHIPIYTLWIALSDHKKGYTSALQFAANSHLAQGYSWKDVDRSFSPEIKSRTYNMHWDSPIDNIEVGDAFLFNIKTLHKATIHCENFPRMSFDTRIRIVPKK